MTFMNMNALRLYCQRYRYVPVGEAIGINVGLAVGSNVCDTREMKVSVYI